MVRLNFPEQFSTERLTIHRSRYEDAEEVFYAYASKPEATRYISWPTHRSVEDTKAFLQYAVEAWKLGTIYTFTVRLKESARLIGSFGIINDDGKLQFGYIFSPTQWNQGYATEVCAAILPRLTTQPGVYRIQSFVDIDNTASAKVLVKNGLVEEARLVKWLKFVNQNNQPRDCIHFRLPF